MSLLFVVNQTLVLPLFLPSDLEKGLKMDLVRFLSLVGSPFLLGVFPNTKELCYSAVLKNSGELASSAIIGYVFNKGQSSQSVWFSTWFYSWSCSFCELYSTVLWALFNPIGTFNFQFNYAFSEAYSLWILQSNGWAFFSHSGPTYKMNGNKAPLSPLSGTKQPTINGQCFSKRIRSLASNFAKNLRWKEETYILNLNCRAINWSKKDKACILCISLLALYSTLLLFLFSELCYLFLIHFSN